MMATQECPLHDNLKQAFVQATETDTTIAMRTIKNSHRFFKNKAAEKVLELESRHASLQEIVQVASGENARKMYREGDLDVGIIACGQGVGLCKDIPTVKELLDRIMKEAEEVIQKLTSRFI